MKRVFLLIVLCFYGYHDFSQAEGGQQSMNVRLNTNVSVSKKFGEFGIKYASYYRVDMVILDRAQMNAIIDPIFGGESTLSMKNDQSLFWIMRVYMKVDSSFRFIGNIIEISILDEDLRRHGLDRLGVGLVRPDEVFLKIIKLEVYDNERDKLLKKKNVDLLIDRLSFM
jgi:hypothetical protein